MNYVQGRFMDREECAGIIDDMPGRIADTLSGEPLQAFEVIEACDKLGRLLGEEHVRRLVETGMQAATARRYLTEAKSMLCGEYLWRKVRTELGVWQHYRQPSESGSLSNSAGMHKSEHTHNISNAKHDESMLCENISHDRSQCRRTYIPLNHKTEVREHVMPLGVLFHIAAGNVDALPAYTIIEGLLAGNINIAKLPGGDNGLSVRILDELVRLCPKLAGYIYVFDYSSRDETELKQLAAMADAVVVWGGDAAVAAARAMAKPDTRIIEWGHKLSFAYGVPGQIHDEDLHKLAAGMVESNQLLCSSCQGLYIDTSDMNVVEDYAKRLLAALDRCAVVSGSQLVDDDGGKRDDTGAQADAVPAEGEPSCDAESGRANVGIRALVGLKTYTERLESVYKPQRVFSGQSCNVVASAVANLEPAIQFGNCWIKPLPRAEIIAVLKPYKNHLQTAALLCSVADRDELAGSLLKAGVVRICGAGNMSEAYCGMPHDGEYTLRRYTRVVCEDYGR